MDQVMAPVESVISLGVARWSVWMNERVEPTALAMGSPSR
jgi:hypothetical protein